jgi:hypothetical protein
MKNFIGPRECFGLPVDDWHALGEEPSANCHLVPLMKILAILLSVAIGLPALAAAAFLIVGRERTWTLIAGNPDLGPYDFEALRRRRTPNDALLCSPGLCGDKADGTLPVFDEPPAALMQQIEAKIRASNEIFQRVDDGSDPAYARYVTFTPLMRFPDTNDIEAVTLADGRTGLRAYARAQLGKSDGGTNRARLKRWLARK